MRIAAYEVRPDEKPVIEARCKELGIELISTGSILDSSTVEMSKGCDGVTTHWDRVISPRAFWTQWLRTA